MADAPAVSRHKPSDMNDKELDAELARLARIKRTDKSSTRRLVASSLIDRLLDEKLSRPAPATTDATPATDTPTA